MKIVNRICQILAIIFGAFAVALFFVKFATITTSGTPVDFIGAQLGFGSKVDIGNKTVDMARSADILFCFWLSLIGTVLSAVSFKFKGLRYTAPALTLISGVYTLVIALSSPYKFVDLRPLSEVSAVVYSKFVIFIPIALLLSAAAAIAYLLIDDYLEVKASKGSKLTIPKRVIRFFRDYKSEIKKIVWPGIRDVAKNTGIVLIMCLLVGAFIWLIDLGLGKLLELILGV